MSNDFIGQGVEGISSAIPRRTYTPYKPRDYGYSSYYDRPQEDPNATILGRDHAGWKVEEHTPEWMVEHGLKPHFEEGHLVYIQYGIWRTDLEDYPFSCQEKSVTALLTEPEVLARCRKAVPEKRMVKAVVRKNNVTASMGGQVYLLEVVDGPMEGLQIIKYPLGVICADTLTDGAGRHVDDWYIKQLQREKVQQTNGLSDKGTLVSCRACSGAEAILAEKDAYLETESGLYYHQDHKPETSNVGSTK